jgi:hypothetical protein
MKTLDVKTKKIFYLSLSISMILLSVSLFLASIDKSFASPTTNDIVIDGYTIIGGGIDPVTKKPNVIGINKNASYGNKIKK